MLIQTTQIALFKGKQIRKTLHNDEWWFVVEDVVLALIDSNDPKQYIQRMKQRDPELAQGWVQFVHTLEVSTEGGKQGMNCANTEGIFRIIQSIPSPKAEPFKRPNVFYKSETARGTRGSGDLEELYCFARRRCTDFDIAETVGRLVGDEHTIEVSHLGVETVIPASAWLVDHCLGVGSEQGKIVGLYTIYDRKDQSFDEYGLHS